MKAILPVLLVTVAGCSAPEPRRSVADEPSATALEVLHDTWPSDLAPLGPVMVEVTPAPFALPIQSSPSTQDWRVPVFEPIELHVGPTHFMSAPATVLPTGVRHSRWPIYGAIATRRGW